MTEAKVKAAPKSRKKAVTPPPPPRPELSDKPTAAQMEAYITAVGMPTEPVKIAEGSVVVDAAKFVEVQLLNVNNANLPNRNRWLFYNRLLAFCKAIG